jgi:hypothetical protein
MFNATICYGISDNRDHRGHDHMVLGFTTTCAITKVVNLNPAHGEVSSIQHCVIKFVSDLRQVGCFLRVLRFSPPIRVHTDTHYQIVNISR